MPDFIRLLPDSVANQIAAGEVIQRPASAVKELLENSVDAGASVIRLLIKDAGKTLIQIVDNGTGMSVADARMCFERHATSKIRDAKDLFAIRTLGFRGEALASIAAIAQVELKTRKEGDELGTQVIIEGSRVKSQDDITCPKGTSILVKNIFFNVPARRNFLKSDTVEFRHILEEFQRVALVHPDIELSIYHNEKPVMLLPKENLKQRVMHIFGNGLNEKLLNVETKTDQVQIYGFVGKPETARKTRGEQYFFANGRFIRHNYLHHAVEQAFEELIPDGAIPSYFLFIEVSPDTIDVNIHPTKTEVNFQFGPLIYGAIRSSVKQALGMFSLSPTLNFDAENSFDFTPPKGYEPKQPVIKVNPDFNPFQSAHQGKKASDGLQANRDAWEKIYEVVAPSPSGGDLAQSRIFHHEETPGNQESSGTDTRRVIQVHNRFILVSVKSGLMFIEQQKALERILFEQLSSHMDKEQVTQQKMLFPVTFQLSPLDSDLMSETLGDLEHLGFEIGELGGGVFVVNAIPVNFQTDQIRDFMDGVLEDFKKNKVQPGADHRIQFAKILASNLAAKRTREYQIPEMQTLIDELFSCSVPEIAPDGQRIVKILSVAEIEKLIR